jgi:hypothetical protein
MIGGLPVRKHNKKIRLALFLVGILALLAGAASAQSIVYVPLDDRPYSLDRVLEAATALGVGLHLPPESFFRGQEGVPDFDELYEWLASHRKDGPSIVAADAFLFGGLVSSRTHELDQQEISRRFEGLRDLSAAFPKPAFVIFGTLLRLPRQSQGILDAEFNAEWAPQLFRLARLQSMASRGLLSPGDLASAERLLKTIPVSVLREWANRRNQSLRAANRLLALHSSRGIDFVGIGLDDNVSPLWLEQEFSSMASTIENAPRSRAAVVPGVDQMGLLLFGRVFLRDNPKQKVYPYFPAIPEGTPLPTYSGFSPGESLEIQADVLGVQLVTDPAEADLVLVVNPPADGRTREASSSANRRVAEPQDVAVANEIQGFLSSGKPVALADIAFDNGADNGLMEVLRERKLLGRLAAYSGGNTSDNAIGLALAGGVLARWMPEPRRKWILFTRLLDEWGYQANVRPAVSSKGSFGGQASARQFETDIQERLSAFSRSALEDFGSVGFKVSYPWGRLFEIRITGNEKGED